MATLGKESYVANIKAYHNRKFLMKKNTLSTNNQLKYVFQDEREEFFSKMVMNWKKDDTYKRHMYVYKKNDIPKSFYIVLLLLRYTIGYKWAIQV